MKICEVTQSALSPEFLRWFAGSKVVNPDGSPKVVFHGTAHDFDQFDRTKDIGYHFASSDVANRRLDMIQRYERSSLKGAGGLNLIPAYLRLTKPVYMSSDPGAWYSEFIILDLGRTNSLPVPVVQQLRQFYDQQVATAQTQFNQENGGSFEPAFPGQLPPKKRHRAWATVIDATNRVILARIKETLIQHGYDGIIYPNEVEGTGHRTRAKRAANPNNISYVVFSPNQIKGAFNDRPAEGPKFMESAGPRFASDPRFETIRQKAQQGLRVWRGVRPEGPADPGDFGTGTYYSTSHSRSNAHSGGQNLRQYDIRFSNPIVLAVKDAYDLADRYGTVRGLNRQAAAMQLNRDLRAAGFDGLISVNVRGVNVYPHRATHTELELVDLRLTEAVQISGKMIAGEPPIVRFRRDAARIEASLPPVPMGHVRLWRGNRPGEIGRAQSFTSDLPGIALPFREPYGGDISYVDVPQAHLPVASRGGAPDVEFFLPREISVMARPVGVEVMR